MKRNQEYFKGCLIGGAIGDALGWPIEFMTRKEITQQYGSNQDRFASILENLSIESAGKISVMINLPKIKIAV